MSIFLVINHLCLTLQGAFFLERKYFQSHTLLQIVLIALSLAIPDNVPLRRRKSLSNDLRWRLAIAK